MIDAQALGVLVRDVLREGAAELVAESCAWAVGLSDQPHWEVRDGHLAPSGSTLGDRAATGRALTDEGTGRFALSGAVPGSFRDALNALTRHGTVHADAYDEQVLQPFTEAVAVRAAERLRVADPETWAELVDDVGEDDPGEIAQALEWDAVLRTEAERLVLDALGDLPLVEVEAEGAPLAVVRAAEQATRAAASVGLPEDAPEPDDAVLFLAEAALDRAALPRPVPPDRAQELLSVLLAEGIEPDELRAALPHLPVLADTADRVTDLLTGD